MTSSPGAGVAQRRTRAIVGPVIRRLWTINREGYERLPADGPAILCPNHISFLDSAFLLMTLPRNISFVGKAEYMDSWKTKFLFPAMGMIPIDRSGGAKSLVALDAAEDVLRRGELFGIFPEGTRSRDGYLYRGRTGAARLAMKLDCPIFPVGIVGTDKIQPPDAKLPKPFRECTIKIGRPITPARYRDRPPRIVYRSMMDEVMFEIRELTGQVYRDVYAGQQPESEAVVPARVGSVDEVDERAGDRELVSVGSG
ncbi:MAG TPA: lysophospholipid acyltransferase family protein [Ilumatobacteraceae bacterium]|nr:lysophospholipid acyltransferase family protein [Ilumatobacteraceae bacterium]